jgi:hypothetical protein
MLGYVTANERGTTDALLRAVAARLTAEGVALIGAVQDTHAPDACAEPGDPACQMDLTLLPAGQVIRISQTLGRHATGCRLDTDGLERAAGHLARAMDSRPALMVINKFGRQEAEGRGFRPVIGQAVCDGVPVLTAVAADHLAAFCDFAGDQATALPADLGAVLDWCHARLDRSA